jgi:Uma2 family endonuclease
VALLEAGENLEEAREAIRRMSPPYLLRKYEATPEDYDLITDEDLRCELVDGVLIVHSPATLNHEDHVLFLAFLLRGFVDKQARGRAFTSNAVMQIGERRLCPDVSVLLNVHADRIRSGRVFGAMDLVVEVLSKSTRAYDLGEKRTVYRQTLAPEIWFVDPEERRFQVDWLEASREADPDAYQTQLLTQGRWASRILPGFWMEVDWLWSDPLPNSLACLQAILG